MNAQFKQRLVGGLVLCIGLSLLVIILYHSSSYNKAVVGSDTAEVMRIEIPISNSTSISKSSVSDQAQAGNNKVDGQVVATTGDVTIANASKASQDQPTQLAIHHNEMQPPSHPTDIKAVPSASLAQSDSIADKTTAIVPPVAAQQPSVVSVQAASSSQKAKQQHAQSAQQLNPVPNKKQDSAAKPVKAWVIQLASFSQTDNADKLVAQLRQKGYESYSRTRVLTNGAKISQVFVGPLIQRSAVDVLQKELAVQFNLKGIVKYYKVQS